MIDLPRSSAKTSAYSTPSIDVQRLEKQFSNSATAIFSNLSFSVSFNESLCLLGPSGCGKTTLLRLLMGLEKPTSGTIHIADELKKHMSYVFQEPRLVPWRTCLENVLLPLELTGQNGPDARTRALELLHQLGLSDRLQNFPNELSGGMQMRVALARALAIYPKIILFDEPFAALDERSRFRLQDLLLDLKSRLNLQYVFVTHSIAEAVYLGDRIMLLDNNGSIMDWRSVQFPQRNQMLKVTPSFNSIVEIYAQLFSDIELSRSAQQSSEST